MAPHIALLGLLATLAGGASTTLYVSPLGNDGWSGALAAPNADRTDGPLATLQGARDALRERRKKGPLPGPVTVSIRGGSYALPHTLVLQPEDSGTAATPVTFSAYPQEKPELIGGRAVRSWRAYRDGIFVAELTAQGFADFRAHELFYRGRRQVLARFPNLDPQHPVTGGMLYVEEAASGNRNRFHYKRGAIPFDKWGDCSQAEINIFPYNCWDHNLIRITKVEPEADLIVLKYNVSGSIFEGNRYHIQNVLGALDAPGEWFTDYRSGKLYFRPPDGKAPADGDVVLPVLENLIELAGTKDQPVEHVRLQGLRLRVARQDAVNLEGARNCEISGCTINDVGGVGVNVGYLRNLQKGVGLPWRRSGAGKVNIHSGDRSLVFGYPCEGCRVAGNDIFGTGGEGIVLQGARNLADNNHLYLTGLHDRVCAGLTICGEANTASHNVINDVPRDGIFINGKLNVAEYNEIRNSMLYTADNAAIALRQHNVAQAVKDRGNILRYNRLLDTVGYGSYPHCTHPGKGFASPFCSFGIYLDGSICGVTVYGNVIARTGGDSIFVQFGGGNVIENNILVEGTRPRTQFDSMVFFGTFMYSDTEGKYKPNEPPNSFRHNIFSYGGPQTDLYRVGHWSQAKEWDRAQATFADNLIWHFGRPVTVCMHPQQACASLAEWQAQGQDAASIVADPEFVDAAHDDYRLRPGSPAYRVGFTDINDHLQKVGCYRSAERASWPLENAALKPEQPQVFDFPVRPPVIVDGFERALPAQPPAKASVSVSGTGTAAVTAEVAKTGRQSLRFVDGENLKNPWEPHVYYPLQFPPGPVHLSVDLRSDPQAPAAYYLEARDWAAAPLVGPSFRVTEEGEFLVNGRFGAGGEPLARVPLGTWYNVSLNFASGLQAPGQYTLTLTVPGQAAVVKTLPWVDAGFRNLTWFGISSTSTHRAIFYVDNLILGPPDAEAIKQAETAPAITGAGARAAAAAPAMRNAEGLIGSWSFEDAGAGGEDASGNGLHLDVEGLSRAEGPFGKALYLDGGGGAARAVDTPLLQFGRDDFTIECWLYPLSLAVDSAYPERRLIEKCGWPETWWDVDVRSDGRIEMEMADASAVSGTTVSAGKLPERAWTHLVIVVERAKGRVNYYLNGTLDSTRALPPTFSGNLDVPGLAFSTGTWQTFNGLLDDLRLYRRALAPEQIGGEYSRSRERHASSEYTVLSEE